MRKIILLLLLTPFLMAQTTIRDIDLRDLTVIGGAGGSAAAPDWTESFIAVWDMESTGTEPNQETGSCATDCDLLENSGTIAQNAVDYAEGSYSRDIAAADTENLQCTGCTDLHSGLTGDFSVVGWVSFSDLSGDEIWMDNSDSNTGFRFVRDDSAVDEFDFLFGNGSSNYRCDVVPSTTMAVDTWYHLAYAHDDGTGQTCYVKSGSDDDSDTSSWTGNMSASILGEFNVGDTGTGGLNGGVDEMGVFAGILSEDAICRVCSCGIDGSACTVSGSSFTDSGRWATMCGSCGSVGTEAPCPTDATPGTC